MSANGNVSGHAEPLTSLILFTRVPVPGRAKTRLLPVLAADGCAHLQRAMVLDQVERLASLGLPLTISYADDAFDLVDGASYTQAFLDEAAFVARAAQEGREVAGVSGGAPAPLCCALQEGAGLGARMSRALEAELAAGASCALLMGSDLPLVTSEVLAQTVADFQASEADVLLCPSEDGGYWCVGLREPFPELFDQQVYGVSSVFENALAVCRAHGRSVMLGPVARDVDTPADLAWLAALARAADPRVGVRTGCALRRLGQIDQPPAPIEAPPATPARHPEQPRAPNAL